jgi:hypothetical protein
VRGGRGKKKGEEEEENTKLKGGRDRKVGNC